MTPIDLITLFALSFAIAYAAGAVVTLATDLLNWMRS